MNTHPDIGRIVMFDGRTCVIKGVSYSHMFSHGGLSYHLLPVGTRSLSRLIQYITPSMVAFDPPEDYAAVSCNGSAQIINFSFKETQPTDDRGGAA